MADSNANSKQVEEVQSQTPGTTEVQKTKLFSLEILTTTKQSQNQNGLRHSDYQRYRNYCTRRIRRIRKALKFTHGKNRYQKKTIEPENVTDSRFLLLVLMKSERAWSYAMQMKDDATSNPRVRVHMHHRLAKAAFWAKRLELLCNAKADKRTILEAEAYAAWMGGNILLEKEVWEDALAHFVKARTIFDQLGKVGDFDYQEICRQKVEETEPSIRYCNYNLKGKKGEDTEKILAEMRIGSQGPGMELLQSKLDSVISESLKKQADTMREISWKNKRIPIRNDKLRLAILNAQETVFELERTEGYDNKMSVYDKLFVAYNDGIRVIRDELATSNVKSKSGKVAEQEENLQQLKNYLSYMKISKTVDRNLIMAESYEKKILGDKDESEDSKKKRAKPDDVVRVYEIIIQNMREMGELVSDDQIQSKEISAKIYAYKALRCFFMALSYQNASRWQEALALFDRAAEQIKTALEHYATIKNVAVESLRKLEEIENRIRGQKAEAHARGFLDNIAKKLEKAEGKPKEEEGQSLLNNLNSFDFSFAKNKKLISFPPNFEPIRCKPLLFDLAYEQVTFPSLEARKQSQQKSGGGFWGWFGGAKQ